MLNNNHFKIVKYFSDSREIFPTSDIKGGIAITYFDRNAIFKPIGTFIPFPELNSIHKRVVVDNENFYPLSEIIFAPETFYFTEKFHTDNPTAKKRLSAGHAYDLTTNIFEKLPEIFLDDKPNDDNEYIQILGLQKMRRCYKWVRRDYIKEIPLLTAYKVMLPKSNGSGAIGEQISTPLVGCTQTFITVGAFDTRAEAAACYA